MNLLFNGRSEDVLRRFAPRSFDAVICDPPYGLGLHGAAWDDDVPSTALWDAVRRVMKPGAHLVAFGAPRTYHRLVTRIEASETNRHDRLEIRDMLTWVHGGGMNKSVDVSLSIDRVGGNESIAAAKFALRDHIRACMGRCNTTVSMLAEHFEKKSIVANWLRADLHGLRTPTQVQYASLKRLIGCKQTFLDDVRAPAAREVVEVKQGTRAKNLVADGKAGFKATYEVTAPATESGKKWYGWGGCLTPTTEPIVLARRYFDGALGHNLLTHGVGALNLEGCREDGKLPTTVLRCSKPSKEERSLYGHPTLKPIDLLRRLIRLVAPPGSRILDPFAGTGTVGVAAAAEGCSFVLIEREASFASMAAHRTSLEIQ